MKRLKPTKSRITFQGWFNLVPNSDSNIALKCAWNDSGYKSICRNCPKTNPSCELKAIDVSPEDCWERHIFERWDFGSGTNKHIANFRISELVGKVVVFTTKKPNSLYRTIFGVARVKNIRKDVQYPASGPYPAGYSDMIEIDPKSCVEIPNSVEVNFEQFYNKRWSQGLFRYLPDKMVYRILLRIRSEMQKANCTQQDLEKLEQLIKIVVNWFCKTSSWVKYFQSFFHFTNIPNR